MSHDPPSDAGKVPLPPPRQTPGGVTLEGNLVRRLIASPGQLFVLEIDEILSRTLEAHVQDRWASAWSCVGRTAPPLLVLGKGMHLFVAEAQA